MTESTPIEPGWAHRHDLIAIGAPTAVPSGADLALDRDLARETAVRYSWAYDERRLDLLEVLLSPDVDFLVSVAGGDVQAVSGRGEVVAWLAGIMAGQDDQRRHVVSNLVIEHLDAESATLVGYLAIFGTSESSRLVTTGFYRFGLVKVDHVWVIRQVLDGLDSPF